MPVMAESHESGGALELESGSTIADGLAVRVAIPLAVEHLRLAVDAMVRVTEREIAASLVACHAAGIPVEPSAAAALAGARHLTDLGSEGAYVVVLTGRNVDEALVERARDDLASFPD
jgi:threonine dehydratase